MQIIKFQIINIIILVLLWTCYRKNRNLQTSHDFLYKIMIFDILINVIFDIITVYTVNHIQDVPYYINDISHRIFIITLDLFVFILYLYALSYAQFAKEFRKIEAAVSVVPIILSVFVAVFGPIYYRGTSETNYSYGPVPNTVYISILFYLIIILYYCLKYRNEIDKRIIAGIFRAVIIVVFTAVLQFINPNLLISSGGEVLVVFILFISFENNAEFIHKKTGMLNEYAFFKVINDRIYINKPFYVTIIYKDGLEEENIYEGLKKFNEKITNKLSVEFYRLYTGSFAFISNNLKEREFVLDNIKKNMDYDDILTYLLPNKDKSIEIIMDELESFDNESRKNLRDFDENTLVKNRNAYERKLNELNLRKNEAKDLWGIIVDVNNLKKTNDVYGHAAGDHLIQMTAKILTEAIGNNNEVYRIGGDEFAVLLNNYSMSKVKQILLLIENIQNRYNKNERKKIEFSIGFSYFNEEDDVYIQDMMKRADRNMYLNKRRWHKRNMV